MLAYIFWHRPYATINVDQYENSLKQFQQRLFQQHPPPGLVDCASFRVSPLPWLGNKAGYEDWCLLQGSWGLDPLNAFAVTGTTAGAHDEVATQMEDGYGGLYSLVWGEVSFPARSTTVWLTRPRGIQWRPVVDGLRERLTGATLWRRQMVLGPGKEFALIVPPTHDVPVPSGWAAVKCDRDRLV